MRAYERLMEYAQVWTTSDEASERVPSTQRQFDLAVRLVEEMKELGIDDAAVDSHCYVTGTIPATPGCEDAPAIGFIAHLDTAPDFSGEHVRPQLHRDYDGGVLEIGAGLSLDPAQFPHLPSLKGRTLLTADGTTLLGADDKAGIAEILTLAEILLRGRREDNLPAAVYTASAAAPAEGQAIAHGKICLAFTPDEEIGGGAALLDIPAFGAKYAYTVDGGAENEITYETFNAASAAFDIQGVSVHPGDAKDVMVNAALVACEINSLLPGAETPAGTEGYEGFFHLTSIEGDVSSAHLRYIVRDHSSAHFEVRQEMLRQIEKRLNEKYGAGTVTLTLREQYRNMEEKIRPCMHLVENAKSVMTSLGLTPDTAPVRGGTDGAQLSYRGLPCPNLGTGGYGFHGPYEHISVEGMDTATAVLLGLTMRYAQK